MKFFLLFLTCCQCFANTAYVTDSIAATITPVDTVTNVGGTPITTPPGEFPAGIAITPDGKTAYVSSPNNSHVLVVDLTTNQITDTLTTDFAFPYQVVITPDGTKAYVGNTDAGSTVISVIDIATNTVTTIGVGSNQYGVAVTPDGQYVYAYLYQTGHLAQINVNTNVVVDIPIPGFIIQAQGFVAITPNGQKAYITGKDTDPTAPGVIISLTLPGHSFGNPIKSNDPNSLFWSLTVSPDGNTVYVPEITDTKVYPISVATDTLGAPISSPSLSGPFAVAITPDGTTAYVSNNNNDTLAYFNPPGTTISLVPGVAANGFIAITPDPPKPPSPSSMTTPPTGLYDFDRLYLIYRAEVLEAKTKLHNAGL